MASPVDVAIAPARAEVIAPLFDLAMVSYAVPPERVAPASIRNACSETEAQHG
jgi:hypothetical protein